MTNKEAAYILSSKCVNYTAEELTTAFNLAFKALEESAQGEWIMNKTSSRGRNYTCTNCQKVSRNKSKFCPKCGANMKGNEHER